MLIVGYTHNYLSRTCGSIAIGRSKSNVVDATVAGDCLRAAALGTEVSGGSAHTRTIGCEAAIAQGVHRLILENPLNGNRYGIAIRIRDTENTDRRELVVRRLDGADTGKGFRSVGRLVLRFHRCYTFQNPAAIQSGERPARRVILDRDKVIPLERYQILVGTRAGYAPVHLQATWIRFLGEFGRTAKQDGPAERIDAERVAANVPYGPVRDKGSARRAVIDRAKGEGLHRRPGKQESAGKSTGP